ncbi:MAG: class III extradiol ring-cleavage dioxygenase, partial [Planctomycetota bacterium]
MPALFVGHGSPMNALFGPWHEAFRALAANFPRPRAILAISAHWATRGFAVTTSERPPTIHDFGGFPAELFAVQYPAPGAPELAQRVRALCGAERVRANGEWGLDHGTWSVLAPMFPAADVPVVQLSLERALAPREHLELARALAPLRDEGVLVLGSGNVTHNLGDYFARLEAGDTSLPEWAERFDADVAAAAEH